jgi:L-threonylcarbamoyladenylate synthase
MNTNQFTTKITTNVDEAADLLKQSEVVAIPTETVYGLAANAFDLSAVAKIFEAKNRPFFDPLIVHTYDIDAAREFVTHIDERLLELANHFWPGPLTLLLPKKAIIPDLVTSGLPHVGVRVPAKEVTLNLLKKLPFPLAAPSANPFGYVSPTTAMHVFHQLEKRIPLILDGGPCEVGLESTIVGIENNQVVVYRLGGLTIEQLEKIIGTVHLQTNKGDNPAAPGMLSAHYSPNKSIIIGSIEEEINAHIDAKVGIISFQKTYTKSNVVECITLSPEGNLQQAAQQLFGALRKLDNSVVDLIITEQFPNEGLGKAINDRLQRAAFKRN